MKPLVVLISGAPGSGKTTLGRRLADELQVPHLNKDIIADGLWRTHDFAEANYATEAFRVFYAVARTMLAAGVSLVVDQTMYRGVSDAPDGERQLVALGRAVHLHCVADNATERWRAKIENHPRLAAQERDELFRRVEDIQPLVCGPLDLGCPRLIVDTTDGYDPTLPVLVRRVVELTDGVAHA